jgi:hypothetical protein
MQCIDLLPNEALNLSPRFARRRLTPARWDAVMAARMWVATCVYRSALSGADTTSEEEGPQRVRGPSEVEPFLPLGPLERDRVDVPSRR